MQRRFDDFRPYTAEQIAFFGSEKGIKAPNVQGAIEESLFNNPSIRSIENTFRGKSILGSNIVAYNTDRKPTMVLVFDDGFETDYEVLYPIAKEYKVPIHLAIIPIRLTGAHIPVAERASKYRPLTIDKMREMQDSGYIHFLNHGLTHTRLGEYGTLITPKQNDTVIYPNQVYGTEFRRIWVYDEVDLLLIDRQDNNINETVTVTSINTDNNGQIYFQLKHPIKNNYTENPILVLHPKTMESEIKDGADLLRIYGFGDNDSVFVYPFGALYEGITDIVVAKYYGGGLATLGGRTFVENIPLPSYNLKRELLFDRDIDRRAQIDSVLAQCVNDKGLVFTVGHSWDMYEIGITNLKYTIEKCMDLGIEITTVREAMDRFSNKIQIGDESMNNHFIIDRENNIHIKSLIFTLPNGDKARLSINNDGEIQIQKL